MVHPASGTCGLSIPGLSGLSLFVLFLLSSSVDLSLAIERVDVITRTYIELMYPYEIFDGRNITLKRQVKKGNYIPVNPSKLPKWKGASGHSRDHMRTGYLLFDYSPFGVLTTLYLFICPFVYSSLPYQLLLYCRSKLKVASKRQNMFYRNKKQETTEMGYRAVGLSQKVKYWYNPIVQVETFRTIFDAP
ncbi:hypothetical protein AAG570_005537 [Ranatra chinensis]|uniref:Uncharacterized protein n=1 Tax=Ranatra chinensis TaxID=642074 RepID=A0ABD0XXR1_9HEMI